MRYRIGDKGFVKGLFIVLIIVAAAFVAISFGKPYYRYLTARFSYQGHTEIRDWQC